MARRGSIQNQATTSEDASASATAWLPRDVLAGILLRLPASDLRRCRRVCKEWREVISDQTFIDEHMDHGPKALNHTIVFFPGSSQSHERKIEKLFPGFIRAMPPPYNGAGYLLDEHWRVTARFTVTESEDMVGACNGLLCFLDVLQNDIHIVEPFTGESITLPLPPETEMWHNRGFYCFGFDRSSRRYKLLHLPTRLSGRRGVYMYMYTIGEDTTWRSVHVAGVPPGDVSYSSAKMVDGAMYWPVRGEELLTRLVRLDLAAEEATSAELTAIRRKGYLAPLYQVAGSWEDDAPLRMIASGDIRELVIREGAHWANSSTVRLPDKPLCVAWPEPLQRGQLLIWDYYGDEDGLYAHAVAPAPASQDLAQGNVVLKIDRKPPVTPRCNTRGLFVPVPVPAPAADQVTRVPLPHSLPYREETNARTFCYAPPVSPAPLACYFGKHCFEECTNYKGGLL